jgi:hypothetical protein
VAANVNGDGSDNPEGRAKNRRVEVVILNEVAEQQPQPIAEPGYPEYPQQPYYAPYGTYPAPPVVVYPSYPPGPPPPYGY